MYMKRVLSSLLLSASLMPGILAWTGQDLESGDSVEITSGNLVREGEQIEYDSSDGDTHFLEILSMDRFGNTVTIEGIDSDTGESRTFEMID